MADPWDEFADAPSEAVQPAQQPIATAAPEAATAPVANDQFAQFADAPVDQAMPDTANLVDGSGTIAGFSDELPPEVRSRLTPEQLADWTATLKPGVTAQQLSDKMRSFGFDLADPEGIAHALATGQPISQDPAYQFPEIKEDDGALAAGARGVVDTVTMGADNKLSAAAQAVNDVFSGKGDWGDRYDANLDYTNAVEANDEKDHPYARIAGQLVGGLALPTGLEGIGARAGALAMREARAAGSTFEEATLLGREAAARAVRERMTAEGATYGMAYGLGSADTLPEAAAGGVTGGITGVAGGAALGAIGEKVAPRLVARAAAARAAPIPDGQKVIAAADRIGMDVLPADVGGPGTRRATGAVTQAITGAMPIVSAARRVIEQGKAARDRVAAAIGPVADPELAGERAIEGATGQIRRSASRIGRIYDTAAGLAGNIRLPLTNAKQVLDEQIARLREVPGGGAGLKDAEDLRASLDGDFTVQGIRDMRTEMFVAPDFRGTPVERRLKQIVNAAADDIHDGLMAAGKGDAARAFRAADDQWKTHIKTIERVVEPIIGKAGREKSGEEVVAGLERAMKGGGRRFEAFLSALPDADAAMVRATLIGRIGRSSDGAQNAEGTAFSLNDFLTHWNKIGERSKAAAFGPEGRAALNDLARVAQGSKEAGRYANHSNSAGGVMGNLLLTGGAGTFGVKTFGMSLIAPYLSGKLSASPRFARWLARAPKSSLSQAAYVDRLGRIARAEPAIATDVLALQKRLTDSFAPAQLAAQNKTDSE